jgi:heme-degrading monooxygenase HmoA
VILALLRYPALAPTVEALAIDKQQAVPFFETIPGLIDKTWAMDEASGNGVSVYHFEDRSSAEAWFDSDQQRRFRAANGASFELFDVGAVVVRSPLR